MPCPPLEAGAPALQATVRAIAASRTIDAQSSCRRAAAVRVRLGLISNSIIAAAIAIAVALAGIVAGWLFAAVEHDSCGHLWSSDHGGLG